MERKPLLSSCVIALAAAAGCSVVFFFSFSALRLIQFFSSDNLYLPGLYHHLVVAGDSVRAWAYPPAPYFFPDGIVYFLLRVAAGTAESASGLYSILQIGLMFGGAAAVAARCGLTRGSQIILCGALAAPILYNSSTLGDAAALTFNLAFIPSAHFSALILALLLFLYFQREERRPAWCSGAAVLFIGAAIASDRFLVTFFAVPLIGAVWWQARCERGFADRAHAISLQMGLGTALGLLGDQLLRRALVVGQLPGNDDVIKNIREAVFGLLYDARVDTGYAVGVLILIAATAAGLLEVRRVGRESAVVGTTARDLFLRFAILAQTIGLIVPLATGLYRAGAQRYLIPVIFLAIISLVVAAAGRSLRGLREQRIATGLLCAALAIFVTMTEFAATTPFRRYSSPLLGCLDRNAEPYGLKIGLAEYWLARRIEVLSDANFPMISVAADGALNTWISPRPKIETGGEFPRFDFIVMRGLDCTLIRRRFGAPARVLQCNSVSVWLYEQAR